MKKSTEAMLQAQKDIREYCRQEGKTFFNLSMRQLKQWEISKEILEDYTTPVRHSYCGLAFTKEDLEDYV